MKRAIIMAIAAAVVIVTGFTMASCSKSPDDLASNPPVAVPDVAPAPPPAPPTPYSETVSDEVDAGGERFVTIKSTYRCASPKDCTSTKYTNVPKNPNDCTCAAACTPFVVDLAEMNRRKEANERLCKTADWYGPTCPAPDCSFQEFEEFKCVGGLCQGIAMGKR